MREQRLIDRLKANWVDKADALDCYAEIKYYDPLSSWCCYVFAMDEYEETISVLLYSNALGAEITKMNVEDLSYMYNENGEPPVIDGEFRRKKVTEILKRYKNDTRRD